MTDLRTFLRDAGAPDAEIDQAAAEGWLPLLTVDRLLLPGTPRYDSEQLAAAAGVDPEFARQIWRALGFPDVPAGIPVFTENDLAVLAGAAARATGGDVESFIRQVRAFAAAMSRIGAIEADLIAEWIAQLRSTGLDDEAVSLALIQMLDIDGLALLLDHVHRLQARSAVWRRLTREVVSEIDVAVGFADLSDYTALTAEYDADEVADLLTRWEDIAYGCTAELAGRVVKTIGDEVMYSALPAAAIEISLRIVEAAAADPKLPSVRVGVAAGSVIARDGDFYGAVVNLASRLTEIAPPDTVLASRSLRDALAGEEFPYEWRSIGNKSLRGIGRTEVFAVARALR